MGCYIEGGPTKGKYQHILEQAKTARPTALADCEVTPDGDVPVIVLENPTFDAAMVCYEANELQRVRYARDQGDYRPIQCLMVPRAELRRLLGEAHYNSWFHPEMEE